MLRRHFILPISASCAASTSLLSAPTSTRQQRCCSACPSPSTVQFGGEYVSRGQKQKWCIMKKHVNLQPDSKWTWPFAQQFTELVHDPTLSLPKAATPMLPEMQVFAKLHLDDEILRDWKQTGDDRRVYDHCDIEGVMKANGFMPKVDKHALFRASPAERQLMLAEHDKQRGEVRFILEANRNAVYGIGRARQLSESDGHSEINMDVCAQAFVKLCGFDDAFSFVMDLVGCRDFKVFGGVCRGNADCYVVESPKGDLMLIVEDKAEKKKGQPHDAFLNHGYIGRIVGEMLQLLSLNREKGLFRNVFAVRFINYHVTAFRVDPDRQTLATLIETRNVPDKKLRLLCTEEAGTVGRGWSLIDKKERGMALQMMANIRECMLGQ